MRVAHQKQSALRTKPGRVHDPLRCVLGIHHWEWWVHEDVCVRCVRCYRRGDPRDVPLLDVSVTGDEHLHAS